MRIKTGDKVLIIKGRDRGKIGTVSAADPSSNRIKIEGLNIVKRHMKKGRNSGGITEVTGSMNAANVMLVDPSTNKPTRVGYQKVNDKKVRVTRLSNAVIEDAKK